MQRLYDVIGDGYAATRRTDPRIAARIWQEFGDARTVLNVGAGTGSYEPPDRDVVAVEPSAVMRAQKSGTMIGFTSGAFQGSISQANYSAAKGGIVSLVRSAAAGMYKYGVTANCIAPIARTRMSAEVPQEIAGMGDPEDVAPMVVYLQSDQARHVTGQIYTVTGGKIAVWNQPMETKAMFKDGRWSPQEIEAHLDDFIGQNRMPMLDEIDSRAAAAAAAKEGVRPNA